MALLAAYNIAKSYGDRVLFSSVNFELQAKSRTGLVGANGTGKTTLFRLLAGQEQANSGHISLDKNTKIICKKHINNLLFPQKYSIIKSVNDNAFYILG